MTINDAGIALIKKFEQCRLVVYNDMVGVPTVGWGHVTGVPVGVEVSQGYADNVFLQDIQKFERGVTNLVTTTINSNQFSALVSFAFNLGINALQKSHLLSKVNAKDPHAADEFLKWDMAGGRTVQGLLLRREAEKALFLTVC